MSSAKLRLRPELKWAECRQRCGCSRYFFNAFIPGGIVFLVGSERWHEKDSQDLSKGIAIEIWADLKEKRLLNSVNGVDHGPAIDSSSSHHRRRGIFSFLGLSNTAHNGNGFS